MPDLDLIKQEEQGPWDAALESTADDVAAKVRAEGGVPDARFIGDAEGAVQWLRQQPSFNGNTLMGGQPAVWHGRCRRGLSTPTWLTWIAAVVEKTIRAEPGCIF